MLVLSLAILCFCSEICFGGDPYYTAEWSDVIRSCPDFENNFFSCDDLELGSAPASETDDGGLALKGKLIFLQDLEEGYTMDLQVSKCTEVGDEPMYAVEGDFCSTLKNSDTPWHPLVVTFNSSSCPIPKAEYSLDGMTISIEFAKDVLTHEFCGEYKAQLMMMKDINMISCHVLSLAVVEKYHEE